VSRADKHVPASDLLALCIESLLADVVVLDEGCGGNGLGVGSELHNEVRANLDAYYSRRRR